MFLAFLLIITKMNLINNIIILMCALVVKVRTNKKKEEEINYQELIMSFVPSLLRYVFHE